MKAISIPSLHFYPSITITIAMQVPVRSNPSNGETYALGSKELKEQFPFDPNWLNMNHGRNHNTPTAHNVN